MIMVVAIVITGAMVIVIAKTAKKAATAATTALAMKTRRFRFL
jgi:hypothetical protein